MFKPVRNKCLANNIILVDGFSRTGKTLPAVLLSHFKDVEIWQTKPQYEFFATLCEDNFINFEAAQAHVQTYADELLYNLYAGRHVNHRKTDVDSIYSNLLEDKYLDRSCQLDGDCITQRIKKDSPHLLLHIHFIFGTSDALLKLFDEKVKLYTVSLRDPMEMFAGWVLGNYTQRIGSDPREFQLHYEYKNTLIPWFTKTYADEYIQGNKYEKAVLTVVKYFEKVKFLYQSLNQKQKDKVIIIPFENIIVDPDKYIHKFESILSIQKGDKIDEIKRLHNIPRNDTKQVVSNNQEFFDDTKFQSSKELLELLDEIKSKNLVSNKYIKMLEEARDNYFKWIEDEKF